MARGSRLLVVLPDPLRVYAEKGEIKPRYYNPGEVFDEVHFVSFCDDEIDVAAVQTVVGEARMVLHPVGSWTVARLPSILRRVRALAQDIDPQVIRAYDPLVRGWLAVRCARNLGIPSVISVHNHFDDVRRVYREDKEALKAARIGLASLAFAPATLRGATKVVGAYEFAADYARRWRPNDVEVIYNRVDTDQFRPPASRPDVGRPRLLCVGRLIAAKGQETLVRAIAGLDVDLTLVGDGPDGERLRGVARDLSVTDRVNFIPAVPHDKIHELYAKADIFAIPIRWGGVCIPVLEAMATGLPVVVPQPVDEPIPEVVGDAGVVVENTPEGFHNGIQQLVEDPGLRYTLGSKARTKLLALNGASMEAREAALYRQLMELGPEDRET